MQLANVLQYQSIDGKLLKAENELRGCEDRKKAKQRKAFLEQVDEKAAKLDKKAQDQISRYNDLKKMLSAKVKELDEYKGVAAQLEAHTEVDYIVKKLEKINGEIKGLQSEISDLGQEVDASAKEFADLKAKNKQAKEEYASYREKYEKKKNAKMPEIESLKKQLAEYEKNVDDDTMKKYKQKRVQKIFPVFVKLSGDMCGGCSMNLPLAKQNELNSKKMIECEECKRYIYIE